MIKINLDDKTKNEIEQLYLDDMKNKRTATSLFTVLNDPDKQQFLKNNYPDIYGLFYDKNGKFDEKKTIRFLLSSRIEMEAHIRILGAYSKKKSDELLDKIFQYRNFSNRIVVKKIIKKLNVTVCPYCNRQYVFMVPKKRGPRPQLDHYFPKSRYPYLALSLWNFIPSCSNCNMAKSSLDTSKEPILYPYEEEFGHDIQFVVSVADKKNDYTKVVQGVSDQFDLELEKTGNVSRKLSDKADRQMEKLYLDELYKLHSDYVMDILKSKYVRSPALIRGLYSQFPKLFSSYQEVENMLYMSDIRKENWGKRPLSKLTHDLHENTIR